MMEKPFEANVGGEPDSPVINEETGVATRSRADRDPGPGLRDADHVAIQYHIQKLQSENEDSFAYRSRNEKIYVDSLSKLCL